MFIMNNYPDILIFRFIVRQRTGNKFSGVCYMVSDVCSRIVENISRTVVGKKDSIELMLTALFAEGHVLFEDVPGVAKTLTAKSLAKSINCSFRRVQFTPDILPGDITGFNIFNQKEGEFFFQPGPVMTNILTC